jgi:phosphoribosyl 1,2-cyclic phosphate phosphodiesterase
MRIRLLGTGGADGIPALGANTPLSNYARKHGGKDVRTRSAALIDGVLKIDFGPDTLAQVNRDRLDTSDWIATLFTHSDEDHLCVGELQYFLYPFNENDYMPFPLFGNEKVCNVIRERYPDWPMDVQETKIFQPYEYAGYKITPILANHKTDEEAHNLIIEKDGRKLIYATDTGVWCEKTWEYLTGGMANALVIECTEGYHMTDYWGHLGVDECTEVAQALRKLDGLADDARIVTTHHSHLGGAKHCDLVKALGRYAMEPGYDGMEFDV